MTITPAFTEATLNAKCAIDGFLTASDQQAQAIVEAQTAHRTSVTNSVNQAAAMLFPDAVRLEVHFGYNLLIVPDDGKSADGIATSAVDEDGEWTDEHEMAQSIIEPLIANWQSVHNFSGDTFAFDLPKKVSITA